MAHLQLDVDRTRRAKIAVWRRDQRFRCGPDQEIGQRCVFATASWRELESLFIEVTTAGQQAGGLVEDRRDLHFYRMIW